MKSPLKATEKRLFKATLEALRARLRGDVSALAGEALRTTMDDEGGGTSAMPIHMADVGSDAFEQEFTLSLMASEEDTLEAVDRALERIARKTFGICEGCGGAIPKRRLEAIPFAELCIRCAELEERGEDPRARNASDEGRADKRTASGSRPRKPR